MAQFAKLGLNYGEVAKCPPKVSDMPDIYPDQGLGWAVSPDSLEDSLFAMYKVKNWTWLGFDPNTSLPYDNFDLENGTELDFGTYKSGHYKQDIDETIYLCGGELEFYTETIGVGGLIFDITLRGLAINDDGTHAGTLWTSRFIGSQEDYSGFFTASSSERKWTFEMDGITSTIEQKELWEYERN